MQPKILLAAAALLSSSASAFVMPASWAPAAAVDGNHEGAGGPKGTKGVPSGGFRPKRKRMTFFVEQNQIELALPLTRGEGEKGTFVLDIRVPDGEEEGRPGAEVLVNDVVVYATNEETRAHGSHKMTFPESDVVLVGGGGESAAEEEKEKDDDELKKKDVLSDKSRCLGPGLCIAETKSLPTTSVEYKRVGLPEKIRGDGEPQRISFMLLFAGEGLQKVPAVVLRLLREGDVLELVEVVVHGEDAFWAGRLSAGAGAPPRGGSNGNPAGLLPHPPMPVPPMEKPEKGSVFPTDLKTALTACDGMLCRWKVLVEAVRSKARQHHHCGGGMRPPFHRRPHGGDDEDHPPFPPPPPFHHGPHHGDDEHKGPKGHKDHPEFPYPPPPPHHGDHGDEGHPPFPPPPPHHGDHGDEGHPPFPPPPPFHHGPHHGDEEFGRRPPHHKGHKEHKEHKEHKDHKHADHKNHPHGPHHHHHDGEKPMSVAAYLFLRPGMIYMYMVAACAMMSFAVVNTIRIVVERRDAAARQNASATGERGATEEKAGLMAAETQMEAGELPPYTDAVAEKTVV